MRIELLYFDGCPGTALVPLLRGSASGRGNRRRAELRPVETAEDAERERFLGSPTLRIDGVDVEPDVAARDDFGLKCRLYRSDEGQSGVPPEAWVRGALARATGG